MYNILDSQTVEAGTCHSPLAVSHSLHHSSTYRYTRWQVNCIILYYLWRCKHNGVHSFNIGSGSSAFFAPKVSCVTSLDQQSIAPMHTPMHQQQCNVIGASEYWWAGIRAHSNAHTLVSGVWCIGKVAPNGAECPLLWSQGVLFFFFPRFPLSFSKVFCFFFQGFLFLKSVGASSKPCRIFIVFTML